MAANSEAEVSDQIQDILSLCSNEQVFDSRKKYFGFDFLLFIYLKIKYDLLGEASQILDVQYVIWDCFL